ncbi:kelch repeat-containing protein [Stigmatella sp. ncwal1]|uniref:Kelch repeat-containing protein n=1 Tax=Stigmatella ashevillensis TaxID=2995309 RepID=A0ABT5DIQ1_9BACT|nr:kelch repeat-containing protein [Stigmatella ashevillena]MDC0712653.1 kelch repeat-containing protein [Stigmatella ashevillena]
MNQALAGQLSRVTVTLTAAGVPTTTVALTLSGGTWGGTMFNIPVGANRTFTGEAFDAQGQLLFRGVASGVTITEGETAVVALTLQSLVSEPSFENTAPCIDSLVASSSTVRAGGTIILQATAHDPDMGDSISYAWSAPAGSFSATAAAATVWTAPQAAGPVMLTLTVTDSRGAFSTASITLTVLPTNGAGQGAATFTVSFNFAPSVQNITSSVSPVRLGESTTVTASAADADGDTLSYAWSASCAGTWTNPSSRIASFTPSAVPPGESCGNCALTVAVTDGKGGGNTGTLRLCVKGPGNEGPTFPPHILQVYQSAQSVVGGSPVTMRILAEDGDGQALTFSWSAASGTLATPKHSYTSSEVVWTAPRCVPSAEAVFITATVTNALGFSASHRFSVTVVNAADCGGGEGPQPPASTWSLTGGMTTPRYYHQAVLLPSGKVLVTAGYNTAWLDTAEVYDPASGTWAPAGRMQQARNQGYALTVLPSGKVLVTGGLQGSTALRSVEIYDPATNSWKAAAPMTFVRNTHSATVLPSGKVLVIGGNTDATSGRIPEIYDPASDTWLPLAPSANLHRAHQTLILASGDVLVLGGIGVPELYHPATDSWTVVTGVPNVAWGEAWLLAPNKILLQGGRSLAFYDPIQGTDISGDAFVYTRSENTVTRLASGKIMVTGGSETISPITELYDPVTRGVSVTLSMPAGRYRHTATLLPSGQVLVVGGLVANIPSAQSLLFTP